MTYLSNKEEYPILKDRLNYHKTKVQGHSSGHLQTFFPDAATCQWDNNFIPSICVSTQDPDICHGKGAILQRRYVNHQHTYMHIYLHTCIHMYIITTIHVLQNLLQGFEIFVKHLVNFLNMLTILIISIIIHKSDSFLPLYGNDSRLLWGTTFLHTHL